MELIPHQDISDTTTYFYELKKRERERNSIYWAIVDFDNHQMIGSFGLVDIDEKIGQGQIGYGLNPEFWDKGLFKEALGLCLNFAFKELKLINIFATTSILNEASIRGLQSCGFKRKSILRGFYKIGGVPEDGVRFVLTAEQRETEMLFLKS